MQRVERRSEVAAIHCGDGEGWNGRKRFDVVPVVDMSALFLQAVIRPKRAKCRLNQLRQRQKAEFAGRLPCIQKHAEVRRRKLADLQHVFFFNVVRDEPVISSVREVRIKTPQRKSLLLQKRAVCTVEKVIGLVRRGVEPTRNQRREEP